MVVVAVCAVGSAVVVVTLTSETPVVTVAAERGESETRFRATWSETGLYWLWQMSPQTNKQTGVLK